MSIWEPLLGFAPFFLWWLFALFVSATNRRACPDCRAPLPLIQSPFSKTRRQWLEGGFLCPNCGCQADWAGKKVPNGVAPDWPMVVFAFSLPALALAGAVYAFSLISSG